VRILLKNKDFLVLFLGRAITNVGDSIYYVASMWLVYKLGGSPFYSGVAGFLILLPKSSQFVAGPLVDSWSIKRTLVTTQLLELVLILTIPIAYIMHLLTVWIVLTIVPLAAFIEQFAYPSQMKALPLILDKSDLVSGNSLFSFAYKGINMIFNAVGGVLVLTLGATTLYFVDCATFLITATLFSWLKLSSKSSIQPRAWTKSTVKMYFIDLRKGFNVVFYSLLAVLLIGAILSNFALGASMAVLPSFANLRGGAGIYGLLLASESLGVLIGSFLSSWAGRFRVGHFSIIAYSIGAVCWVSAAMVPWTGTGIALFGCAWVPIGAMNILLGAVIQSVIPTKLLARVSSVIYSMSAIAMPLGSLLGGYLASIFGAEAILAFAGTGLLFIPAVWSIHPKLRRMTTARNIHPSTLNLDLSEDGNLPN
jgi:MFS family permease